MSPYDVLELGRDSSGRPIKLTRQSKQRFDRMNAVVGGKLVITQGSFNRGVSASAGTHDLAGAFDLRTWNLTPEEQYRAIREGRRLGGADYLRTRAEGFEPHAHCVTIGDRPMTWQTEKQVNEYRIGLNALASMRPDTFPWRPKIIKPYVYQEDYEMLTRDQDALLRQIHDTVGKIDRGLATFRKHEVERDKNERVRDQKRFSRLVSTLGGIADHLTELANREADPTLREEIVSLKAELLQTLRDDPDVTGVDDPKDI